MADLNGVVRQRRPEVAAPARFAVVAVRAGIRQHLRTSRGGLRSPVRRHGRALQSTRSRGDLNRNGTRSPRPRTANFASGSGRRQRNDSGGVPSIERSGDVRPWTPSGCWSTVGETVGHQVGVSNRAWPVDRRTDQRAVAARGRGGAPFRCLRRHTGVRGASRRRSPRPRRACGRASSRSPRRGVGRTDPPRRPPMIARSATKPWYSNAISRLTPLGNVLLRQLAFEDASGLRCPARALGEPGEGGGGYQEAGGFGDHVIVRRRPTTSEARQVVLMPPDLGKCQLRCRSNSSATPFPVLEESAHPDPADQSQPGFDPARPMHSREERILRPPRAEMRGGAFGIACVARAEQRLRREPSRGACATVPRSA